MLEEFALKLRGAAAHCPAGHNLVGFFCIRMQEKPVERWEPQIHGISLGKKVNADLHCWIKSPGDEYAAEIKFKTGERYFPHFIFRNDTAYLNDCKCYYILDRNFIDFVTEIIKSKGISTCQETLQRREDYRNRKNLKKPGEYPAMGE